MAFRAWLHRGPRLVRRPSPHLARREQRRPGSGQGATVARFKDLSFAHSQAHGDLLSEVSFSIRQGSKVTIMGQNGAGKSTTIKLLSRTLRPDEGDVILGSGQTVACAMQTVHARALPGDGRQGLLRGDARAELQGPVPRRPRARGQNRPGDTLQQVVLEAPGDRIIKSFSGGQQARLLLAAALIQEPSILLLDEPTNNLDHEGLWHLQCVI